MPELPEVENVVRDLRPKLCGKRIKRVEVNQCKVLICPENNFAKLIRNRKIEDLSRKGKCIILSLSNGHELVIHLGMTGQLLYRQKGDETNQYAHLYTRLILSFADNIHELRFADMRRFGWVAVRRPGEKKGISYLNKLGPDALSLDLKNFKACFFNRKGGIKGLLLNQHIISGLGNIYTDEALYQAGIHPYRKVNILSDKEIRKLHIAIRQVLKMAIASGGSTVGTYRLPDGKRGGFQEQHRVYRRQGKPCSRCKTPIIRIKAAGRGTYLCPKCQSI